MASGQMTLASRLLYRLKRKQIYRMRRLQNNKSHTSYFKIVLNILTKRITTKAEEFLGKNQFGFRKGCGTREAIGVMRMLCERSLEHDNELFICFVNFEKKLSTE